jgi:hypothetical protein
MTLDVNGGFAASVDPISNDRASQEGHMHADLMRTTCFWSDFKQGEVPQTFERAIRRASDATSILVHNGHALSMAPVPSNRSVDVSLRRGWCTIDQGKIYLLYRSILELALDHP